MLFYGDIFLFTARFAKDAKSAEETFLNNRAVKLYLLFFYLFNYGRNNKGYYQKYNNSCP